MPLTVLRSGAGSSLKAAITFLSKPEIKLSAITASVNTESCVKCLTCVRSYPYQVQKYDEDRRESVINETQCQGCGVCTAVRPRQTIGLRNYEDDQLMCRID